MDREHNHNTTEKNSTNNTTASSSREQLTLLALCYNYDWQSVLQRLELLKTSPDALVIECQAVWNRGRTPLHVAVDHDAPLPVVEALLNAYPPALFITGTTGMNPLHICCSSSHCNTEVARLLLQHAAQQSHDAATQLCAAQDVDLDTPLHSACRCGASLEVMRLLLLVHPAAALQHDYEGLTPLHRLWVREYVLLGGESALQQVHSEADLQGELSMAWKKTTMLLYAMQYGTLKQVENVTFSPLHAMAILDCPRRVLKMATQIYAKQLTERDANGNTPLLLACAAPLYPFRDIGYDGVDLEDQLEDHLYEEIEQQQSNNDNAKPTAANLKSDDDMDKMSVTSDTSAKGIVPSVIDILVEACPEAIRIAATDGRTPLQVAMDCGKTKVNALIPLEQKMSAVTIGQGGGGK